MTTKQFKMNKTEKNKWLKELRNPAIKQANAQLCVFDDVSAEHSYCCLGVLALIKKRLHLTDGLGYNYQPCLVFKGVTKTKTFTNSCRMTPTQKLSMDSHFVPTTWLSVDVQNILSDMNDNGKSFLEIADWIEKNL